MNRNDNTAAQEAEPTALPVAAKSHGAWDGLESLEDLPDGTELYAHPPRPQADAGAVAVPEGWRLVPVEPTSEMLAALSQEWHASRHRPDRYAAMLAAAPQAPAAAGAQIEWDPLPEDSGERARFDRDLGLLYRQDPRVAITTHLSIWAGTKGNGQFGQQCAILANEVARLRLAAQEPSASTVAEALNIDRVLQLADEHADDSREDGARVMDRGGLLAFAKDVIRIFAAAPQAPAAPDMESVLIDGVAYQTPAPVAAELLHLHLEAMEAPAAPTAAAAEQAPAPESDDACAWTVWWTHHKARYTTPRQAALAAWSAAIGRERAAATAERLDRAGKRAVDGERS